MSRQEDSWSSKDSFHRLQRRSLTGKLPNSLWDYYLQAFAVDKRVTDLVIADDIICVLLSAGDSHACLVPFGRQGEISPLTDDDGNPIILNFPMDIGFVYYNCNNNSLILVGYPESLPKLKILSVKIASIKSAKTNEYREIYAEEDFGDWDFDIPNCRGMICNEAQRV